MRVALLKFKLKFQHYRFYQVNQNFSVTITFLTESYKIWITKYSEIKWVLFSDYLWIIILTIQTLNLK